MLNLQLNLTGTHRFTCRQLKRGGWLALVALCKFALLLAMFRSSAPLVEINYEVVEQASVETACADEGGRVCTARTTVTHRLAVRALHREMGVGASGQRPTPGSCPQGHRLSNGLNAPRLC